MLCVCVINLLVTLKQVMTRSRGDGNAYNLQNPAQRLPGSIHTSAVLIKYSPAASHSQFNHLTLINLRIQSANMSQVQPTVQLRTCPQLI